MEKAEKIMLFQRQKVLLAILQAFGGKVKNRDLQKYLFLFTQTFQTEKSYDFVPYKFGCFSFQSYADRRRLTEMGILQSMEDWHIAGDRDYLALLDQDTQKKIQLFHGQHKNIKGNDLVRKVYREYPYYAIRSEIASDLLDEQEMSHVAEARPTHDNYRFFTIGYEGSSFENYLNRLLRNNIKLLCDVRKNPLSRKYGFSKKTLSETLQKLDIEYVHMPELGIVSDKRQNLKTLKDYDRLFNEYEDTTLRNNKKAVRDLFDLFKKHKRIAITCFEATSCMCHRGRVAKAITELPEWKYEIEHI